MPQWLSELPGLRRLAQHLHVHGATRACMLGAHGVHAWRAWRAWHAWRAESLRVRVRVRVALWRCGAAALWRCGAVARVARVALCVTSSHTTAARSFMPWQ